QACRVVHHDTSHPSFAQKSNWTFTSQVIHCEYCFETHLICDRARPTPRPAAMGLLLLVGVLAFGALLGLYGYGVSMVQTRFPRLKNKRICLLIAHPDDEAMFFAPTLLSLTRPETGNHVKVLCLSTGNANGLGETRKRELIKSCVMLGLRQDDVFVIDSPEFQDSIRADWDKNDISALLCMPFTPHHVVQKASDNDTPPIATVDVLITFDQHGASSHPNHISLYHGARTFISTLMRGRSDWETPVDLYTLASVSTARKYTGVFDALVTMCIGAISMRTTIDKHPTRLLFCNQLFGDSGLPTAWAAMTGAHRSQMAWFRWGWIAFSRYMVLNDLRLEQFGRK
ncbi:N-acetylglucosaminyl-phosphatidylinositol de-N-acetylase, partial [Tolypocladium capitatum]